MLSRRLPFSAPRPAFIYQLNSLPPFVSLAAGRQQNTGRYKFWVTTWVVEIGTAPGWSTKNCSSSRRSAHSNLMVKHRSLY
jgi:hypothetical protein